MVLGKSMILKAQKSYKAIPLASPPPNFENNVGPNEPPKFNQGSKSFNKDISRT